MKLKALAKFVSKDIDDYVFVVDKRPITNLTIGVLNDFENYYVEDMYYHYSHIVLVLKSPAKERPTL